MQQNVTPEGRALGTEFSERVDINVVTGKRSTFVRLYVPLAVFFTLSIILLILTVLLIVLAGIFSDAKPEDTITFFKLIATFDFGNSALQNISGPQTDALVITSAMAAGIVLLVLAIIFGFSLKSLKRRFVSKKTVAALSHAAREYTRFVTKIYGQKTNTTASFHGNRCHY